MKFGQDRKDANGFRLQSKSGKAIFGVQDMTSGDPFRGIVRFSVPLLIGNFAQQLYNTADSIIVGNYIGDTALAAVGTAGPIMNLLFVLLMGIATGASILSAQFFGAKDREKLSRTVGSTIFLTLASGIVMMLAGYFLSPVLIGLMTPPPDVGAGAVTYLQIIFLGILGTSAYNILSGVLRGMGDSVAPLCYLVAACLLNIALDLLFVRGMGIAGAALATIISQFLSGALCLVRLVRMKNVIDLNKDTLRPDKDLVIRLTRLGMPAGMTQAIFSASAIIVQGLTNSMGTAMIAANVAVMRVDGFAMMPNFTWGTAATTYVGQNIGAGRRDRLGPGVRAMLRLALGTGAVLVLCVLLLGRNLISLFTSTEDVISLGTRGLRWLAFGYLCFAVTQVLQGVMRGAGETVIPMWIGVFTTVILRLPLAYGIAAVTKSAEWTTGHPDAIFSSLLISWVVGMTITIVVYAHGRWKNKAFN